MNTPFEEPTIHELATRVAELEQANANLQAELTNVQAERAVEEQTGTRTSTRSQRSSRRKMLAKGLGVAVASVGVGTMLEMSGGTALAAPARGSFSSSVAGKPAVKATGTNGADGVDATSDSGAGVSATSTSGIGLLATSASGVAGHFVGNVNMDNNLTVTGALSSGAGTFTCSDDTTPAVNAIGTSDATAIVATSSNFTTIVATCNGIGDAVDGTSNSGIGVYGISISGNGVRADSSSGNGILAQAVNGDAVHGRIVSSGTGRAGFFEGNVQVNGNFSATGTKAFVQTHPTDPSREIVYVALEGGEAGTYERGTGTLINGKAVVALPEHFGLVTASENLTIQLSSRGEWLQLYTVELDPTQFVVREAQGKSGVFDYLIQGVRKGFEQHEVFHTKR